MIKVFFAEEEIKYDGSQMESLWAYRRFNVQGDSIVAFKGACDIPSENILDLEDLKAKAKIASPMMMHFIIEHFELDLEKAVWRQRLFTAMIKDELEKRIKKQLRREGDDIYDGTAKLTISIASLTPVSSKIHFAINVISKGTPVETRGLADYNIEPCNFAKALLENYATEVESILLAKSKVRGVK